MYFKHYSWKIRKIVDYQKQIDPRPQYQRGPVWKEPKKQLLIDSIINRYDIPKIYLRYVGDQSPYRYEVADGQQRLRSIWGFYDNEFKTGVIEGENANFSR